MVESIEIAEKLNIGFEKICDCPPNHIKAELPAKWELTKKPGPCFRPSI